MKERIFVECGRKFGKTEMLLYVMYRWAVSFPGSHIYYIAPTQKQAKELVWHNGRLPNFLKHFKDKYVDSTSETDNRVWFKNGSFIKIDGAENYEAYRGINPHLIVYDEFKDHDPRFHDAMEPNLATFQAPLVIVGTPPETEDNLFCQLALDFQMDKDSVYFNMPTHTNPHISADWLAKAEVRYRNRGEYDKFLREYRAMRVKSGAKFIFPMFEVPKRDPITKLFLTETKHVKVANALAEKLVRYRKDWEYFACFDAGTASCFAALFGAINKFTKEMVLLEEIYEKSMFETSSTKIFTRALEKMKMYDKNINNWSIIYDNAAPWFRVEVMDKFNVPMIPCVKDTNNKDGKLSLIKDMLLEGYIEVSFDCPWTVWEMENYAKDENDKIPKKNDHLLDCLRYVLNFFHYSAVPKEKVYRETYNRYDDVEEVEIDKLESPYEDILSEIYD